MKVRVKLTPRAKSELVKVAQGVLKVYVSQLALEGRANKRLIEILSDYLSVPKSRIEIIKGHKSRDKIVEIN
ncbi:MAG: DUF167 domain-containing protein [Candidatus Omnitrophota bacterium]